MEPHFNEISNYFFFLIQTKFVYSNINIVYLDVQSIIDNSDLGLFYKKKVSKIHEELKIELSIKEKKIKEKETDLNNKKNILKNEEIEKSLKELNNLINDYQITKNKSNKIVNDEKKKYSLIILKNINPILTNYAKENNITLILEKKNILVGVKTLDVTNVILNLLNKETKNKKLINDN